MPVEVKMKIEEVEKASQAISDYTNQVASLVGNNSNIIESLDNRFDTECVKLNQDFLMRMKNDKLVFFFRKKFSQKPNVLITLKSLSVLQPTAPSAFKMSQVVDEANIETDRFKFSIKVETKDNSQQELRLNGAEVCYVAFDSKAIKI